MIKEKEMEYIVITSQDSEHQYDKLGRAITTWNKKCCSWVIEKEFEDDEIHSLINNNINSIIEEYAREEDNALLRKFLKIPYFPFVITTVFDPIVETIMREIHGEQLRVLCFRNDPNKNDDLYYAEDTKKPTLYYMFGKADGVSDSFVVTDTDMLKFSRSWMLPTDASNNAKPALLSNILAKRYLLIIGYH